MADESNILGVTPASDIRRVMGAWKLSVLDKSGDERWGDDNFAANCVVASEALNAFLSVVQSIPDFDLTNPKEPGELAKDLCYLKDVQEDDIRNFLTLFDDYLQRYSANSESKDGTRERKPTFKAGSYMAGQMVTDVVVEESGDVKLEGTELELDPRVTISIAAGQESVEAFAISAVVAVRLLTLMGSWYSYCEDSSLSVLRDKVVRAASERLTRSLAGILSCFSVTRRIDRNAWHKATGRVWTEQIINSMRSIRIELATMDYDVVDPSEGCFEIGWSWGITRTNMMRMHRNGKNVVADELNGILRAADFAPSIYAHDASYFYFTLSVIERTAALFHPSVAQSEVLNQEQLILLNRLRRVRSVTASYWMALALDDSADPIKPYLPDEHVGMERDNSLENSGDATAILRDAERYLKGRYAIQKLPWAASTLRVTSNEDTEGNFQRDQSDYYTLYLLGLITREAEMSGGKKLSDAVLEMLVDLVEELAQRGRINRTPDPDRGDWALKRHWPGELVGLWGRFKDDVDADSKATEGDNLVRLFEWRLNDYAAELLKRASQIRSSLPEGRLKSRVTTVVNDTWRHLSDRQVTMAQNMCWDNLSDVYRGELAEGENGWSAQRTVSGKRVSSWNYTERVVSALIELHEPRSRPSNEVLRALVASILEHATYEADLDKETKKILDAPRKRVIRALEMGDEIRALKNALIIPESIPESR